MGDVAMTVPVLQCFCQNNPEVKITVVSRKFFKPLFQELPNVSFLEADVKGVHKGFLGLLKLAKEIKTLPIDAVADLHNVIRSKVITGLLRFSGIPSETLDKGRAEKKAITHAHGQEIEPLKAMQERYADVFEKLGYPLNLSKVELLSRKPLTPKLLTLVGKTPKKLVGIAPFAAFKSKMYPLESMKNVLKNLTASGKYTLLLFGGGKQEETILSSWEIAYKDTINVAGKLSFEEELALISNLDVMVSMDSGNGHLAANYDIPVITLWGVTHPYAGFVPFGQPMEHQIVSDRKQYPLIPTSIYGNKFPEGYENVMRSIEPNAIVQKVERVLS